MRTRQSNPAPCSATVFMFFALFLAGNLAASPSGIFRVYTISPANGAVITDPIPQMDLVFQVVTNYATYASCNVTIYKNGAFYAQRFYNAQVGQDSHLNIGTIGRGNYHWNVACTAAGHSASASSSFVYYEDTNFSNVPLGILQISPLNNSRSIDMEHPPSFIWHVTSNDATLTHATCSWQLYRNGAIYSSESVTPAIGYDNYYPSPNLIGQRGNYQLTISCAAGQNQASSTIYFTYVPDTNFTDSQLKVTLVSPPNNAELDDWSWQAFSWHVSSNDATLTHANCDFRVFKKGTSELVYQSSHYVAIGYDDFNYFNPLQRGNYEWSVSCKAGRYSDSDKRVFTSLVDVPSKLAVQVLSPVNNTITNDIIKYRFVPDAIMPDGTSINIRICVIRVFWYTEWCPDPDNINCYAPEFVMFNLTSGDMVERVRSYSGFGQSYFPWYVHCTTGGVDGLTPIYRFYVQ